MYFELIPGSSRNKYFGNLRHNIQFPYSIILNEALFVLPKVGLLITVGSNFS